MKVIAFYGTLELGVISAKHLKDVHFISKADKPMTAYPTPMVVDSSSVPYASPLPPQVGYGYLLPPPQGAALYGVYPPPPSYNSGYGYRPPPPQHGYGYRPPPPQHGYGYPSQQSGYGYPPMTPPKKSNEGRRFGAGLLGGMLRALLIGVIVSDAADYET